MKIAVTVREPHPDSEVDPRFGRAAYFLIHDTATGGWESVDNDQNVAAAQGAGVQAAQTMVARDVAALLTGHCGPKAFRVLSAAGVAVCVGATGTASEAVAAYREGRLEPSTTPDVQGHWA
jgi:predicted Fe-Mo cluster-binding NifX family protein